MIQGKDVDVGYDFGDPVLDGVFFTINEGDRIGVVGPNGSGKTTFLSLLAGKIKPIDGSLAGLEVADTVFVSQEVLRQSSRTVLETLLHSTRASVPTEGGGQEHEEYLAALNEHTDVEEWEIESKIQRELARLGFDDRFATRRYSDLSSGEKRKIELLEIVISDSSSFLLLDEPTNHLDISTSEWLEELLCATRKTVIAVSHDRFFLDRVMTRIFEIRRGGLSVYEGNYSFYYDQKQREERETRERYKLQQRKIRKLKKEIARRKVWAKRKEKEIIGAGAAKGFISHQSAKMAKRAKAVEARLEHLLKKEMADKPFVGKKPKLGFECAAEGGGNLLRVKGLSMSIGGKILFSGVDIAVRRKEMCVLVGSNGSGKTTLIRAIINETLPDGGEIWLSPKAKIGYYPQEQETLNSDSTVLDEVVRLGECTVNAARRALGSLLLREDYVLKKVSEISQGEKAKALIAAIFLSEPNLLILDEPTNHLDIDALNVFEKALSRFEGGVLIVTHDRAIIRNLDLKVIEMGTSAGASPESQ